MPKNRSIITLGSFDGVHRGHQAILKKVVDRARALKAVPAALVFGIPPRFARRNSERMLLTTLAEKKDLVRRMGIRALQVLVFDKELASTTPHDFFSQVIVKRHRAAEMIVGPRVAFGKNRTGKLALLRRLGRAAGVGIQVISGVGKRSRAVSSSAIRGFLNAGHVEQAAAALGYTYGIGGRVIKGDHRGRALGFPTANIEADPGKIAPPGVFWVYVPTLRLHGICNVGTRPTFTPGETQLHVEVFLLGSVGALYRKRLEIRFLRRVRREKRFASAAELVRQIQKDVAKVGKWRKTVALHTVLHSI
jgi:riboflavin kinase / FMN adenylyltransferase